MVCWLLQCSTALWGSLEGPRLGLIGVSPFRDHLDFFGLGRIFIFFVRPPLVAVWRPVGHDHGGLRRDPAGTLTSR